MSQPAPLLGFAVRRLAFGAGGADTSAQNLRGFGEDSSARVRYDPNPLPPPLAGLAPPSSAPPTSAGVVQPRIGASDKGSVLVYPSVELRWNSAGELIQDTFITLQNDYPDDVAVRYVYVNGDPPLAPTPPEPGHPGWNNFQGTLTLTGTQPVYWSAFSGEPVVAAPLTILDPGFPLSGRPDPESVSGERMLRGTLYVWAVDETGAEIRWNHLAGQAATVDYANQTTWEYAALAARAVAPVAHGQPTGTPGIIDFDGVEFEYGFDQLVLDFQAVGSNAFSGPRQVVTDADLTLMPLGADLRPYPQGCGPLTTKAVFQIWNLNEVKFSETDRCVTCWDQLMLGNYDPPNSFLILMLQTSRGKARINGVGSQSCDYDEDPNDGTFPPVDPCNPGPFESHHPDDIVSTPASLVGVLRTAFSFDGGIDRADAGSTLIGLGSETARIEVEITRCCLPTGICVPGLIEAQCAAQDGVFALGACGEVPCPTACCLPTGACVLLFGDDCEVLGGTDQGAGIACAASTCQTTGACCRITGCLADQTPEACAATGGTFLGAGSECNPIACPIGVIGACCLSSGVCWTTDFFACGGSGGVWQGVGSSCATAVCTAPTGACCLGTACLVTTFGGCATSGGSYKGNGSQCAACVPVIGACCLPNGSCFVGSVPECTQVVGVFQGAGTSCATVTCPTGAPTGACCRTGGLCDVLTAVECVAVNGTYQGDGVPCVPGNCPSVPILGACCYSNGTCGSNFQAPCISAGGNWLGPFASCALSPCPPPSGACCFGSTCLVVTPVACQAGGGTYKGTGTTCASAGTCSFLLAPLVTGTDGGAPRDAAPIEMDGLMGPSGGPDLLVLSDDAVQVCLNRGRDATGRWRGFEVLPPLVLGERLVAIAGGRLDADDRADVAAVDAGAAAVHVLLNGGDGSLAPHALVTDDALVAPSRIAIADFTGDGRGDLLVGDDVGGRLVLFANDGSAHFAVAGVTIVPFGPSIVALRAGDVDGDGDVDVVVSSTAGPGGGSALSVLLNDGAGAFATPVVREVTERPADLALGDLERDGWPDVIETGGAFVGRMHVVLNRPGEAPGPLASMAGASDPGALDVGDLTDDGRLDAVVARDPSAIAEGEVVPHVWIMPGGAAPTFGPAVAIDMLTPARAAFAVDVDSDGRDDLVSVGAVGFVITRLGAGAVDPCRADIDGDGIVGGGDLALVLVGMGACPSPPAACPADVNGDGVVSERDLEEIITAWGRCGAAAVLPDMRTNSGA